MRLRTLILSAITTALVASCGSIGDAAYSTGVAATCKAPNVVVCEDRVTFFLLPLPYKSCTCAQMLQSNRAAPLRLQALVGPGDADALWLAGVLDRSLDDADAEGRPRATVEGVAAFRAMPVAARVKLVRDIFAPGRAAETGRPEEQALLYGSVLRALGTVGLGL